MTAARTFEKRKNFWLNRRTIAELREIAEQREETVSEVVRDALRAFLADPAIEPFVPGGEPVTIRGWEEFEEAMQRLAAASGRSVSALAHAALEQYSKEVESSELRRGDDYSSRMSDPVCASDIAPP